MFTISDKNSDKNEVVFSFLVVYFYQTMGALEKKLLFQNLEHLKTSKKDISS